MPLGEELDELLSGYIDGRLTADELQRVEAALAQTAVRDRLDWLRGVGQELRMASSQLDTALPADFASRVMQACKDRAAEDEARAEPVLAASRPKAWHIASALAGLAAMIALAIWLPQMSLDRSERHSLSDSSRGSIDGTDGLGDNPTVPEMTVIDPGRMASDQGNVSPISYSLVLDLELSPTARQQSVIQSLLGRYGIGTFTGIRSNEEIDQAIDRLRFTVDEQAKVRSAEVYLIRAPAGVLDAMISEIQSSVDLFPSYRFDLAFQTPTLSLSQAIAGAVGQAIPSESNFAVSLVEESGAGYRPSPFESIPTQGMPVGASRRQERFDMSIELGGSNDLSYLLLLVR
jgi:hypothetical protein